MRYSGFLKTSFITVICLSITVITSFHERVFGDQKKPQVIKRTILQADPPIIDTDGLSMEIIPITIGQMKDHDDLNVPAWGKNVWALSAGPCFKMKVMNKNEHIIRLSSAVIKLADNGGNLYDVTGKIEMYQKQVNLIHEAAEKYRLSSDQEMGLIQRVRDKLSELHLFEPKAEVLPGFTGVYYLFFELPRKSQEDAYVNADWIQVRSPFKLLIFDVATQTDAAGNIVRKTKYEYNLPSETFEETYKDGKLIDTTRKK